MPDIQTVVSSENEADSMGFGVELAAMKSVGGDNQTNSLELSAYMDAEITQRDWLNLSAGTSAEKESYEGGAESSSGVFGSLLWRRGFGKRHWLGVGPLASYYSGNGEEFGEWGTYRYDYQMFGVGPMAIYNYGWLRLTVSNRFDYLMPMDSWYASTLRFRARATFDTDFLKVIDSVQLEADGRRQDRFKDESEAYSGTSRVGVNTELGKGVVLSAGASIGCESQNGCGNISPDMGVKFKAAGFEVGVNVFAGEAFYTGGAQ